MILINGEPGSRVDAMDRGLQYGDGVFETMPVRGGEPQQWSRHVQRLMLGCTRLGFEPPAGDVLWAEAQRVCESASEAVLKIIVTRGVGGRGYRPPSEPVPTRVVSLHELPAHPAAYREQGIVLYPCETRWSLNPALAGIKHLNRLEQVLARSEWEDPRIPEGRMLDPRDRVVSGTMSNLFAIREATLRTPPVDQCGIAGVTRARIMEFAERAGLRCSVAPLPADELALADEVFVCNSVIGIWPVRAIGEQEFRVGPGTRSLMQLL